MLDWSLHLAPWALTATLALAIAAIGLSAFAALQLPSRGKGLALIGLRTASVALVLIALFQPAWVTLSPAAGTRTVALVVDRSASMANGGDDSRWGRALVATAALAARANTNSFVFDTQLTRATDGFDKWKPSGSGTDIATSLKALVAASATGELGAVVLVSDGADPSVRRNPSQNSDVLPAPLLATIAELGVPIHTIAIDDMSPRDISIERIEVSPFAFVRHQLPVAVIVRSIGVATHEQTALEVRLNGELVHRSQLKFEGGGADESNDRGELQQRVDLSLHPTVLGDAVISAVAVPLADETTQSNNVAHRRLQVLRDRTRVLHLAGHPSWDTRFLRSHLLSDPAVDLVSFYIMIAQGSSFFLRTMDTTLIEFPGQQLFDEVLADFDLVIFQDFQFTRFDVDTYLPELHRYVRDGGAFWVIGGRQAFAAGGYDTTELSSWLPVQMRTATPDQALYDGRDVPVSLTDLGSRHMVTSLEADPVANQERWTSRTVAGQNTGLTARPGADVLLVDDHGGPLLAMSSLGRGRVATLATSGLWTWAFGADDDDREALRRDYHELIERIRGWLTHEPQFSRIRLNLRTQSPAAGQPVRWDVRLRDATGSPKPDVSLRWRLARARKPAGPWSSTPPTDALGMTSIKWPHAREGVWRLHVRVSADRADDEAFAMIGVATSDAEVLDSVTRPDVLTAISEASGGQVWTKVPTAVPQLDRAATAQVRRDRRELWSHPAGGALLVMLLCAEWILRRRWGLA